MNVFVLCLSGYEARLKTFLIDNHYKTTNQSEVNALPAGCSSSNYAKKRKHDLECLLLWGVFVLYKGNE